MTEPPNPNLAASLLAIHAVISRGIDVALAQVRSSSKLDLPNTPWREGFLNYIRALSSTVHGHHGAEDDLAFPYFRNKLRDVPYETLTEQHQQLLPILGRIDSAVAECAGHKQGGNGFRQLGRALEEIHALWHPHIEIEEKHFTEERLRKEGVSGEEQKRLLQEIGEHNRTHTGPPYLVLPFMLYNVPPKTRPLFEAELPPEVVQQLIPVVWKSQWESMRMFLLD